MQATGPSPFDTGAILPDEFNFIWKFQSKPVNTFMHILNSYHTRCTYWHVWFFSVCSKDYISEKDSIIVVYVEYKKPRMCFLNESTWITPTLSPNKGNYFKPVGSLPYAGDMSHLKESWKTAAPNSQKLEMK